MAFREVIEGIRGTWSNILSGLKIALGLTGGISIYRVPDVARGLIRHGAEVVVFMSRSAAKLLSPKVMEWAVGGTVYTSLSGYAEHVNVCSSVDILAIVPATANTIGKVANGIGDNVVALCAMVALGSGVRVIMAPAMNESMWRNPRVRDNMGKLMELGVEFIEPVVQEGKAKLPSVDEIIEGIIDASSPRDMGGMNVLVTSGPTREHIDEVKYITTPSSGLTGYYFAREARARGARVTLVTGPTIVKPPRGVRVIEVVSVADMYNAVINEVKTSRYDLAILTAAPLDFTVSSRQSGKLSSDVDRVMVELVQAPKISRDLKKYSPETFLVAYKAEVNVAEEELVSRTIRRMREGGWDIGLAHDVGKGLGFYTDKDEVLVVDKNGNYTRLGPMHKRELARNVLTMIIGKLISRQSQ